MHESDIQIGKMWQGATEEIRSVVTSFTSLDANWISLQGRIIVRGGREEEARVGEVRNVKVTTVVTPSLVTQKSHCLSHATRQSCVISRDASHSIPIRSYHTLNILYTER